MTTPSAGIPPEQDPSTTASTPPTSPTGAGGESARPDLFHKRPGGIGTAPLFFSVALGLVFGLSVGLLLDRPLLGALFGAVLGLLYGFVRGKGPRL